MALAKPYWDKREYFNKKLAGYTPAMQAGLKNGMAESASKLVAKMKARVPKGPTGKLAASIRYEKISELGYRLRAGGPATTKNTRSGWFGAGSDYDYAHAVEFGTKPHKLGGLFKGSRHPGSAPRPFFFGSYRTEKRAIKKRIHDVAKAAVKK